MRRAWAPVLLPWLVSRALVAMALLAVSAVHPPRERGLLGWDAHHYLLLARHGYPPHQPEEWRFFPLFPLLARAVPLLDERASLLLLANAFALLYALLLHRLLVRDGLQQDADQALWLLALVPTGFVLVMGYAEPLYGVLAVLAFLGLRERRWLLAGAAGALAGLSRPTAVALVAAAAVEAWQAGRPRSVRDAAARVVAVAAPLLGTGAYVLWCGLRTGEPLRPFTVQARANLRGSVISDPLSVSRRLLADALTGHPRAPALHVLWLVVFLALLVLAARRLPASYTAFAGVSLLLAATSSTLGSLERYAWAAFPLLVALATLTRSSLARTAVLALTSGALVAYAVAAFSGAYVP